MDDKSRDLALIARCVQGDEEAWSELYREAVPKVLGRLVYFLRQHNRPYPQQDEAEEILAETLGALVARDCAVLRSFRGESRIVTWLSMVATHRGMNYLRSEGREHARRTRAMEDRPTGSDSDDGSEAREELLEMLERVSTRLTPRDREILHLRYSKDLTKKEIAAEIGVSVNAVGPCVSRAVARLRQLVAERAAEESDSGAPRP